MSQHKVRTVDLAPSAGGLSSGTLANATSYTVVIPPQAGQSLLNNLVANVVVVAGASSTGSPGTFTYSHFLADVAAHRVKNVDLAPSAGSTSSGTLTNGTSYTVVIPPQAGQSLLNDLHANGVQVTGALPQR